MKSLVWMKVWDKKTIVLSLKTYWELNDPKSMKNLINLNFMNLRKIKL